MTLRRKLHMVHGLPNGLTIHSRGGIGNQLFCLFAGLALADKLECRLYIDPSQHRHTTHLPFLVDQLIKKSPSGLSRTIECLREPQTQLGRLIQRIGIPRCCDFIEPSFQFSPEFFSTSKGSCAFGYFQSWRYLELVRIERRNEVREAINHLASNPTSFRPRDIVIHVRRGDYLKSGVREIHGVLPYRYYSNAIAALRAAGQSGEVWVVSEDRLGHLSELENEIGASVTQVDATSPWTDLQTLITSPSLVIANSTFSWMAGWLNQGTTPVVAPKPWFFTEKIDTGDLIPPHWFTVEHQFGD
jgi:hypothetical protein